MRITCLILGIAVAFSSCTPRSASKYNDEIITEQEKVMLLMLEFSTAMSSGQMQQAEEKRLKVVEQAQKSIDKLESLGDFQGNTEFRDAALDWLRLYHKSFSDEYKTAIELIKKESNMTPEDYVKLADIEKMTQNQERAANSKLRLAQNKFAKEHNFTVEENAMQKEIEKK